MLLAIAGAAWIGFPATGLAANLAPPGNSEVNQYTETLPGAEGNHPTSGSNGSPIGRVPSQQENHSALPAGAAQRLKDSGPDGRALENFIEATAPRETADSGKSPKRSPAQADSNSGFGTVVDAVTGSEDGGLGFGLPLILGAVAGAGVAYVLLRRRARLPG
jgi:hypothetical protein